MASGTLNLLILLNYLSKISDRGQMPTKPSILTAVNWYTMRALGLLNGLPTTNRTSKEVNMQLTVHIDDVSQSIEVAENLMQEGEDFFAKMDSDMDQGWQMSRTWVDNPSREERCQIAASKMLDAISAENQTLLMLMAGYIMSRYPQVREIRIDTSGDMTETELVTAS